MSENPLERSLKGALSEYDFAVLEHGFARDGRDYRFLIQDSLRNGPGTYELVFTHVVDLKYETRVGEKVWPLSWADEFTDFDKWKASSKPAGYVFGTEWSRAYPEINILLASPEAQDWSNRLRRPMHSASIETDRFCISLVFSETRHRKVSDGVGIVRQMLIPLPTPGRLQ